MRIPLLPTTSLCVVLLCATLCQQATAQSARQLRYRGQLESIDQRGNRQPVDEFSLLVIVEGEAGTARSGYFAVTDDSGDRLPWHQRFGQIVQPATDELPTGHELQFGYRHAQRLRSVSVGPLFIPHEGPLADGMQWTIDGKQHAVDGTKKVAGHECWQVEIPDRLGRWQKLAIDKQTDTVLAIQRRLFMGQGDRFELALELESQKSLNAEELDAVRKPLKTLLALKKNVDRKDDEAASQTAMLDQLAGQAAGTPVADFAALVQRETKADEQRTRSVAELADRYVGSPLPDFELQQLGGGAYDRGAWSGKTVVLHFWEYKDEPLEQPYGQVGYLDFLSNRLDSDDVVVLGIAVDPRLTIRQTHSAAVRSVKKLKRFMNLGYDIALDEGAAIKALGDPRRFESELPLWVVLDGDGKVVHYKVGLYSIDPNRGLEELDALVRELQSDGK
ncbi:Redoxin [Maioricimonas rarisocia]|uniref:Redoxin n=1 Tax=Maioricimonas rarisocia TaxID=2528026 RepID=A0A517Z3I6_9PLAN|nr:TlpA disulfide reductase family protein [Maioricimonas rarisocia]QDU37054.1 Redoxin [Maioricimonas rarisocia]